MATRLPLSHCQARQHPNLGGDTLWYKSAIAISASKWTVLTIKPAIKNPRCYIVSMGTSNRIRKIKLRHIGIKRTDERIRFHRREKPVEEKEMMRNEERVSADRFFEYNPNLGPPYHVLVDTSFLNYTVKMKLDLVNAMIDCLYAKAIPYVTDCVIQELERHGQRFGIALRLVKDPRVKRLKCDHDNIGYADDCLCNRAKAAQCYIVATNDVELKHRIRKLPGIPIMSVLRGRYGIERLADAAIA